RHFKDRSGSDRKRLRTCRQLPGGPSMPRRATLSIAATAILVAGLLLPMSGSAVAQPSVPIGDRHPGRDWMGSQVAAHMPKSATNAAMGTAVVQTPGLDVSSWQ